MARVRSHTRKGRRVKAHSRALQPRRAAKNAKRAYRSARRRWHSDAVVWGSLAAAEIGAWLTMRGFALTVTTIGIALLAGGVAVRRMT